jgi:hypothetical protein
MEDISRQPTNIWEAQTQGLLDNYAFLEARLTAVEDQLRVDIRILTIPISTPYYNMFVKDNRCFNENTLTTP